VRSSFAQRCFVRRSYLQSAVKCCATAARAHNLANAQVNQHAFDVGVWRGIAAEQREGYCDVRELASAHDFQLFETLRMPGATRSRCAAMQHVPPQQLPLGSWQLQRAHWRRVEALNKRNKRHHTVCGFCEPAVN
jgi:hypothetical protein